MLGAGVSMAVGSAGGVRGGMLKSGILLGSGGMVGSDGMVGSGATGGAIIGVGSGKGPTGSPSSPVSPSGMEEGAATGSEKTGSTLVVLVMSSIAFCKSLSTV